MPTRLQQPRRPAAERHDIGVGLQHALRWSTTPVMRAAVRDQAARSSMLNLKLHAEPRGLLRQRLREHVAVAGLVVRQAQAADELVLHAQASAGSAAMQPSRIEHFVGHAVLLRAPRCRRRCRRAASACGTAAACPGCARHSGMPVSPRSARRQSRLYSAMRHHPALVDGVARRRAVAQHLEQPRPHGTDRAVGRITSGPCRINSHLIAFTGTPGPAQGEE